MLIFPDFNNVFEIHTDAFDYNCRRKQFDSSSKNSQVMTRNENVNQNNVEDDQG
jgi:hypothetical protein